MADRAKPLEVQLHRGARKRWQRPRCQVLDVDGMAVRVRSHGPLTDRDREAIADLLRAVHRHAEEEVDADG